MKNYAEHFWDAWDAYPHAPSTGHQRNLTYLAFHSGFHAAMRAIEQIAVKKPEALDCGLQSALQENEVKAPEPVTEAG